LTRGFVVETCAAMRLPSNLFWRWKTRTHGTRRVGHDLHVSRAARQIASLVVLAVVAPDFIVTAMAAAEGAQRQEACGQSNAEFFFHSVFLIIFEK
jgi:hypothetical protein